MFLNSQQSFFSPELLTNHFLMDSDIACPSSQSRSDCELQNKFANCRKNLLIFLHNVNVKNDLKVNFKVIKKYYKMSFDQFPESNEIMQIFEKITQRFIFF